LQWEFTSIKSKLNEVTGASDGRMLTVKAISALAGLTLLSSAANGQFVVRGTVVEGDGRTGVAGTLVKVERSGVVVARALTAESGAFVVPVTDAGGYTVTAQRIGFKPVTAEAIAGAGVLATPVVLRMAEHIETLSAVRVLREERCGSDLQRNPDLQAL
jgi:hypothetical protein